MHSEDCTVQQEDELEKRFLSRIRDLISYSGYCTRQAQRCTCEELYKHPFKRSYPREYNNAAEGNAIEARRLLKKLEQYRKTKPKKK